MRIAVLCATWRGQAVLQRLAALLPTSELVVFSFREDPVEPPFMDAIRQFTLARGGQFIEARRVSKPGLRGFWESTAIDLMLVVSWRYLIPSEVHRRPRLGTFVFHDSLLPAYRGFSPTVWAIVNGEDHTGATLFKIADGADTGDVVDQQRVPIGPDETIASVMGRVTDAYLDLLDRNLGRLLDGSANASPQDESLATYCCKRVPEDNEIDWRAPSDRIYNLIRAVSAPYSGAWTFLGDRRVRVWSARRLTDGPRYVGRVPGRVVEIRPGEGSVVLTGDDALLLTEVELEGRGRACASDVLNSPSQTLGRAGRGT